MPRVVAIVDVALVEERRAIDTHDDATRRRLVHGVAHAAHVVVAAREADLHRVEHG